ncbi:MAG: SH3 superfamily protein [Candidatus Saganbacteria bacterium]|uniref:SH3 superfamily protein n=1 Tax=Candidatus Saganbacteria bacterium TaxID=2575572 RepID=A0A833L0P0_UNCSA|nr:MAG: SH3 superfamily protein [Candidatus Saganbacteria bacterium]
MKKIIVVCILFLFTVTSSFAVHVGGYTRSNGTYVQPYERSAPNNTVIDNYNYKGNINPYTGEEGTNKYIHDPTSEYYQDPSNPSVVIPASKTIGAGALGNENNQSSTTSNIYLLNEMQAKQEMISIKKYNKDIENAYLVGLLLFVVGVSLGYAAHK